MPEIADIERVRSWVEVARRVVVLTGAGISTRSVIADFRGPQGAKIPKPRSCRAFTRTYLKFKELELRRRKGMRMLARGVAQAEVARALKVSRQTTSSWAKKLAEDAQAWRRKPLGRPGGLDAPQKKQLGKALLAGAVVNGFPTELWTLAREAKLIEREFGVAYSTVNVWRILRELGFSSQRPAGRAIQRDEAAIKQWRAKRWPALKKSAAAKAAPSSSSTKAD